ncbi:MAG: 16S rRNA (cytidine(1402)-2'-O)-methyltransferase [Anaerolineales bacterium]|nr:16S rRNA (cytidine(1402)-2'-O)-methyltransferase [Anaerolineales bacterium]
MGTLYLVATPIGNLEDITARALRILREAALIAAEDTRHTRRLLTHFAIHTPLTSYYEHNKLDKLDAVLAALETGDVALVSDAGTPALSDPGYELVRAALAAGHAVTPVPGPSAVLAALVASGLPTDAFVYLGFLPRKDAERRRLLESVRAEPRTLVAYEAPHRLLETLADLRAVLGDRPAAVARELTKLHEEIFRGTLAEAAAHFAEKEVLGEITLVVAGAAGQPAERWEAARVRAELVRLTAAGLKRKEAARQLAQLAGWSAREIYNLPAD